MRVLVFGRTGQVARELNRRIPQDVTLMALGRDAVDLADPDICAAAIAGAEADVVINVAAYTAVDAAEANTTLALRVNGAAPGAMARACAARGLPFIHVSTDYVFDGSGTRPWRPGDATAPLGVYGRSKLAGERAVCEAKGIYAILRTSWVFSAYGRNFVTAMLRLAKSRDDLRVVDDQIGGPTAASDIADALLVIARALVADKGKSGTYHFAGCPDVSWADFAREIFAQASLPMTITGIPTSDYPTLARRPLNSRLDCRATETVFGIPRPNWRGSLSAVLQDLSERAT